MDLGWWSMAVWRHLDALLPGGALVALFVLGGGLGAAHAALQRTVERVGGAIDDARDVEEQAGVFLTTLVASGSVMLSAAFYGAFLLGLALSAPHERALEPLLDAPALRGPGVALAWGAGVAAWASLRAFRGWRRGDPRSRRLHLAVAALEVPLGLVLPMALTTVRVVASTVSLLAEPRPERATELS